MTSGADESRWAMRERLAHKHFERGRSFELQDRVAEALEAYRQACSLEPQTPEPFFALGRLEAGQGRCESALRAFESAVRLAPGGRPDTELLEWRAYIYGRMRRFEEALVDYQVIESRESQIDPVIKVNAGRMLLALRRYDEAEVVLQSCGTDSAQSLIAALPRYREFDGRDPVDDARASRYLFAGTMVIGTQGDGGLPLANTRYLMLTPRHCATTIGRFLRMVEVLGWKFDAVAGDGPHHGPVAQALAELLECPMIESPQPGMSILLASAVISRLDDSERLRRPWVEGGCRLFHIALGLAPTAPPSLQEPEVVGIVSRSAVWWYRVEPYSRLVAIDDSMSLDGSLSGAEDEWPGFQPGPVFVNPNRNAVAAELVTACREDASDPFAGPVMNYFERHPKSRAYAWGDA